MLLDERHERAITSLMLGEGPTVAARKAGVTRSVIYDWYKKPEFMDELKKRKSEIVGKADAYILSNVTSNIDRLQKLAEDSSDKRTQKDILIWLVEKSLGKTTTKIAVDTGIDKENVNIDVLDAELLEFDLED